MDVVTREFALIALDEMGGEVRGKTLFQKRLYFLGLLTGCLESLGFVPHFYGPYSATLADAVGQLRSIGFLTESFVNSGARTTSGFEVGRRDYEITDDGTRVVASMREAHQDLSASISNAWERIKNAGDPNYLQLSIAAKVFHILHGRDAALTSGEISGIATGLGWTITEADIDKAEQFLLALELIELVPSEPVS